jgi:hypothetical protein
MSTIDIDAVVGAYIGSLLWSESCRGSVPTDDGHEHTSDDPADCDASFDYIGYDASDLAPVALAEIIADVTDFVTANSEDLAGMDPGQIGHDFLLTRNRHGAGFWDRGLGDKGDRLTAASHPYGETSAYMGDDGKVHVE